MAKFNVTCIRPEGFLHSSGFNEVIDSLAWSLAALGHDANVTQNWLSEHNETNIVFGAELVADFQRFPRNTLLFNLEQPSHPNMAKVRKLAHDSGIGVWDYSSRAVEEWKAAGHDRVCHLPIGYTPILTRIPYAATFDYDVLFVGWLTPRRTALIDELRRAGLRVFASAACYGGGRDNLISRSKVILNVHHDGRDRFEIVRCSYLMANGKCIVTEPSSDDDEYEDLRPALCFAPYRIMVDTCASLCKEDREFGPRQEVGRKARSFIERRDFTQAVAAALDAMPSPTSAPAPSRPLEFKMARSATKREFLAEARNLRPYSNVAARYAAAQRSGDMKDFVTWMREHAKNVIVEIGTRDGASTSAFLSGVEERGGHVYSIDCDASCGKLFEGHPQWTFIHANSADYVAVARHLPLAIDLLLIDGDHSAPGVTSDFTLYSPLVRPGGLILFHDIAPEPNPGAIPDWPDDSVKTFYASLCSSLAVEGWTHEEPPGRYGLGVLHKPVAVREEISK